MENKFMNVGFRIVTKTFDVGDGKPLEYERLEILLKGGVVLTIKIDEPDINLLKWVLKNWEKEVNHG